MYMAYCSIDLSNCDTLDHIVLAHLPMEQLLFLLFVLSVPAFRGYKYKCCRDGCLFYCDSMIIKIKLNINSVLH